MANKININDYNLDFESARIYVAFILWLTRHPNGGKFTYGNYSLEITKQ